MHREEEPERDAGTTALAALVAGDALLVANAGDCRAVLCRRGRAIDLSRDHNGKSEAARVEAAGEAQHTVRAADTWAEPLQKPAFGSVCTSDAGLPFQEVVTHLC